MAEQFVYPPRNLPGRAEDWGRAVEARDKIQARDLTQLAQKTDNGLRATAGQLAVVATQIDTLTTQQGEIQGAVTELQARRTHSTSPANLSITNNATTNPPSVTRTFSFPAPEGGARTALVFLSADLATTLAASQSVTAFARLEYGSSARATDNYILGAGPSRPSWYSEQINFQFYTTVPAGEPPEFTLRLSRLGFTSTSTTVTASDITAIIQYGDRV